MSISLRESGASVVVLDIEGTTTPVSFVYRVLFPFARARLRDYIVAHSGSTSLAEIERDLRAERAADANAGLDVPDWSDESHGERHESLAAYCEWLMDQDRKSPPLKTLQGLIWESGYRSGELLGDVFDDVPGALARWRAAGARVAIYSSGSVLAQRLLFGHTRFGDLTIHLNAFFDTAIGPKKEPQSYGSLAKSLACSPSEMLFISDSVEELNAARAAGLLAALCARPGNAPVEDSLQEEVIRDLAQITP